MSVPQYSGCNMLRSVEWLLLPVVMRPKYSVKAVMSPNPMPWHSTLDNITGLGAERFKKSSRYLSRVND